MYGYSLKDGVGFLKFETFGGVFAVFCGDVAACAGHAACFMFGAFENHLNAIAFCFLCHCFVSLEWEN